MVSHKKAMSPLIATVFLIAFAVAIGVMIMNWTPPETSSKNKDLCENVELALLQIPCSSDNKLVFGIKNVGSQKIDAIKLKTSTGDSDLTITIKSSSLIPTESVTKEVPFIYQSGAVEVTFIPLRHDGFDFVNCGEMVKSYDKLPPCY